MSLCIRFDKIDALIKIYDGIRYLVILNRNWFQKICDSIKYFVTKQSGITDSINHNLQESALIYIIIYLLKNTDFSKCFNIH